MSYRLEAWSLPSEFPFEKKVADIKPLSATGGRKLNGASSGSVAVPANFDRLPEIHNPEGSIERLFRAFDNQTDQEIWHCFARQSVQDYSESTSLTYTGSDVIGEFETTIILPRDGVNNFKPSKQPDWIWGADNGLLDNPEFDDEDLEANTSWESGGLEGWKEFGNPTSLEVIEDPAQARTGDWVIKMDPDADHSGFSKTFDVTPGSRVQFSVWLRSPTTGRRFTMGMSVKSGYIVHGLNQYVWQSKVYAELENVPRGGGGNPPGSTSGVWQKMDLDVTVGTEQTSTTVRVIYDHHAISNGPVAYVDDFTFSESGAGLLSPWYGFNATIVRDGTFKLSAPWAVKVVTDGTGNFKDGIEQQVEGLIPGQQYTYTTMVYQNSGSDKRFTMAAADSSGGWIADSQWVVPHNQWTKVWVTFIATTEKSTWILRVNESFSVTFWMDNARGAVGLPATTIGDILRQLLSGIQSRGAIDYIVLNFDAVNDTSVFPWQIPDISTRVQRGRTFKSVLDMFKTGYGIEYEVKWTGVAYELRVFENGNAGTDRTFSSSGKLSTDDNFISAQITRRSQSIKWALAEGDDLRFWLSESTTGPNIRREGYIGDVSYLNTLQEVAQSLLNRSTASRFEVRMTVKDGERSIWSRVEIGDLVNVELPPDIDISLRVVNMVYVQNGEDITHIVTLIREPFQEKGG